MNRESLPAGTILIIENEQYTIEKTIGWGGSALVYAAKKNDSSVVIKELYPQGCLRKNGQIVSEKNTIIDSIKHIDFSVSSVRQILPGLKYISPPPQDKIPPKAGICISV